ncbi:hypothetical protein F4604DRAFT_1680583 [Suillus subluteus]|nr:hypothetical protein F4604DRAFT_1680583 [Suillus subluteus]
MAIGRTAKTSQEDLGLQEHGDGRCDRKDVVMCQEHFLYADQDDAVPDSPHGRSAPNAPQMDEETCNWPIPDRFVTEFDTLKYNYQPVMTNEVMNGAIVEVHFSIHQWHIKKFDSFQANVQKIVILRPAPMYHTSAYKHELEVKKMRHNVDALS